MSAATLLPRRYGTFLTTRELSRPHMRRCAMISPRATSTRDLPPVPLGRQGVGRITTVATLRVDVVHGCYHKRSSRTELSVHSPHPASCGSVLLNQENGASRNYRSLKSDYLQYYHPLSSAHSPRMPSVSASKSITYPQLPQLTFTTPRPSVRSCSSSSKSALR